MELDKILIEEKLSEADQEAEETSIRYTSDEVLGRAKECIYKDHKRSKQQALEGKKEAARDAL